jgi:hypothetical protein
MFDILSHWKTVNSVSCQVDILMNVRQYVCSETYLLYDISVRKYEIRTNVVRLFGIRRFGIWNSNVDHRLCLVQLTALRDHLIAVTWALSIQTNQAQNPKWNRWPAGVQRAGADQGRDRHRDQEHAIRAQGLQAQGDQVKNTQIQGGWVACDRLKFSDQTKRNFFWYFYPKTPISLHR